MVVVNLCSINHPDGRPERCVRNLYHPGQHAWIVGENIASDVPTGPIIHMAAKGLVPQTDIQHPDGECAWCDAERWRQQL